jgi:4-aminobutyrate aminotransferase
MGWGPGAHGSTFGGNPVSCAAALATIRLLEGGLVENAALRGREALDALRPLVERFPELVREIRGLGLMIGISFDSAETAEAVQWAAFQRGLLVLEAGDDAVRISPPLVVASEEIATGIQLLGEAVGEVAASRAAVLERAGEAGAINEVEAGG